MSPETIEALTKYTAWPAAGAVVILTSVWFLRDSVGALLTRLSGFTAKGVTLNLATQQTQTSQQAQASEVVEGVSQNLEKTAMGLLPTDLADYVRNQVEFVRKDIDSRKLDNATERELLIRAVAATQIFQQFERLARLVYGSQLQLLVNLNTIPLGAPVEESRNIYNLAQQSYPEPYKRISFDQWLGFLTAQGLIVQSGGSVAVSPKGRDFLKFLVDSHDTGTRAM